MARLARCLWSVERQAKPSKALKRVLVEISYLMGQYLWSRWGWMDGRMDGDNIFFSLDSEAAKRFGVCGILSARLLLVFF